MSAAHRIFEKEVTSTALTFVALFAAAALGGFYLGKAVEGSRTLVFLNRMRAATKEAQTDPTNDSSHPPSAA